MAMLISCIDTNFQDLSFQQQNQAMQTLLVATIRAAVVQKSSSILFFLSVWISFFVVVSSQASDGKKIALGNIHLCMMNCGQCKEMYGDYFEGQRCAEFCLASYKPSAMISGWAPMPDCNEPETVDQFLKLSLMPQSDGPSAQQLIDDSVLVDQTGDGGGYRAPISQALIGPSYSGRLGRKPSSAQQNTFYSSRTGAEFKGHNQLLKNRKWKKRINGSKPLASALSMPRWYFV